MIHTGDCIEVMAGMPAESVDAVVTDPPYGINFMGKAWDGAAITAQHQNDRAKRVLPDGSRPKGGGSGFGTAAGYAGSYDFSLKGNAAFQAWCEAWGREALRVTKPGGYLLAFGGTRTHHRLVCGLEDAGWIIRDELDWVYASGFPKGKANLKPAHEPIVLARKPGPLRPLNIEENRIAADWETDPTRRGWQGGNSKTVGPTGNFGMTGERVAQPNGAGRWPSNLLLSSPALFDEPNPEVVGSGAVSDGQHEQRKLTVTDTSTFGGVTRPGDEFGYGDSGGYSRFFIIPKADRADREPVLRPDGHEAGKRFSTHPTMKPVDLMRHLIRLVTPPGGTVLDCFAGSGSTLIAAELEGFAWVGIEQDASYVAIAEARLNGTQRGLGLDVPAPTRQRTTTGAHGRSDKPYLQSANVGPTGFDGKYKAKAVARDVRRPPEEAA